MRTIYLVLFMFAAALIVGTLESRWDAQRRGMPAAQPIYEVHPLKLSTPCAWICKPKPGVSCDNIRNRICASAADLREKP